jgi:peptidoglycan/LPS O-acetylase OafA/YrhL
MAPSERRNFYIDRLRGISILLVLCGHSMRYIGWWTQEFPAWFASHIITSAYYGVSIFFVISGFLITGKFVRRGDDRLQMDVRRFYIQRIGRIVPPLSLLIMVSGVLAIYCGAMVDLAKISRGLTYILELNFSAAETLIPHSESSYDPLWSLSIEEGFYIVLPMLCLLIVTQSRLVICLIAAVITGFLYRSENIYIYSFFGTFDQLATGGLLAIYVPRLREWIGTERLYWFRWASLVGIAALCLLTDVQTNQRYVSVIELMAALYIIGAPPTVTRSFLPLRLTELFGALSYEIYLFHMMIFWAIAVPCLKLQAPIQAWAAHLSSSYALIGINSSIYAVGANFAILLASFAINLIVGLTIAKAYSEPTNRAIRMMLGGGATVPASQSVLSVELDSTSGAKSEPSGSDQNNADNRGQSARSIPKVAASV